MGVGVVGAGRWGEKIFSKKNLNLKKKSRDRGRVWRKVEVGGGGRRGWSGGGFVRKFATGLIKIKVVECLWGLDGMEGSRYHTYIISS